MTAVAIPVVQRTPEWSAARMAGIGASEAAAAVGLSPWESPYSLWARKCGLVPEIEQSPAMLLGELMEPVLATLYEHGTGIRLRRRNQLLRHPEHAWMLASLDRVRPGRRIVELKHTARGDGYGEPGTDEVPEPVLVQVIHQMAVLDAPEADVAVLIGGRAPIRVYTVARDHRAEAVVIEREREFWRHVETRTEPPLDGSDATARTLAAMYPRDNGEEITADGDTAAALAAYRDVSAAIEGHEANRKQLRAVLERAIGTAAVLVAPGIGHVIYRTNRDRTVVAWEALAADYREAIERELEMVESGDMGETAMPPLDELDAMAARRTTTKTGSRPFLPRWEGDTNV